MSEQLKTSGIDTKFLHCPSVPTNFPKLQKSFSALLSKKLFLSLRMHSESIKKKPAKYKRISSGNFSKRCPAAFYKESNFETKKDISSFEKCLQLTKVIKSLLFQSITIYLFCNSFFRPCFCVEQEFDAINYKSVASKILVRQNPKNQFVH